MKLVITFKYLVYVVGIAGMYPMMFDITFTIFKMDGTIGHLSRLGIAIAQVVDFVNPFHPTGPSSLASKFNI